MTESISARPNRLKRTLICSGLLIGCQLQAQIFGLGNGRQKDIDLGVQYSQMVEAQMGLDQSSPAAAKYVDELGFKMAQASGDPDWNFSFKIIDDATPNAFALPGGPIYVSRGLLALSCNEDELAGVIAHEIAHVTQRHGSKQNSTGLLHGVLALPGNVVGGVLSEGLGNLINLPVDAVGGAMLSQYSRSHENEADEYGLATAARAGYDPSKLADILLRLKQDVEQLSGHEERFSIFDSHPMTEDRIRRIQKQVDEAEKGPANPIAADTESFYAKLDGLWWGVNPAAGIFREQRFLHPDLNVTMRFPQDWVTMNTPTQVAAVEPNQQGAIILSMVESPKTPEQLREDFILQLHQEARVKPIDMQEQQMGGQTIYIVTYLIKRARLPVYMHMGWVEVGKHTFQLTALGDDRQRQAVRASARSLRELTSEERASINGLRLRIAEAKAGETLAELGARTGNSWDADYTALVNDLSPEAPLEDGQPVKIARLERY